VRHDFVDSAVVDSIFHAQSNDRSVSGAGRSDAPRPSIPHAMSGPYEDEIMRLRLLSAAHPNVRILTHLAEAYRKAGDLVRAREAAERGIARHSEYPSARIVLGRVLWEMGDAAGAEREFRRVLELDPENRIAREWLSQIPSRRTPDPERVGDPGRSSASGNGKGRTTAAAPTPAPQRNVVARYREPDGRSGPTPPSPPAQPSSIGAYFDALLDFRAARPGATPRAAAPAPTPGPAPDAAPHETLHETLHETPHETPADAPSGDAAATGTSIDVVALTDRLIGLLEHPDPYRRGEASLTRLIAVAIGRECGMTARELDELALAALLRDLGRLALARHGGAPGDRAEAEAGAEASDAGRPNEHHVDLALRLLDGIELPEGVRAAIRHHRERWDGRGYPDRLSGHAIPRAARILAVAESLVSKLSPRPNRPARRLVEAIAEIDAEAGRRYDPEVVDALIRTLPRGLRQRAVGFALRHHIIVVDGDHPRALALAARLGSHGFMVETAADPQDARALMRRLPADALVVASDLPRDAALEVIDATRADAAGADVAIVAIHANTVQRRIQLLERGADVCFASDVAFDEMRAALGALLRRHAPATENPGRAPERVRWSPAPARPARSDAPR